MAPSEAPREPKVLVVEDEYLIARELAETLEDAGLEVLGPVATLDAAFGLLGQHQDIAAAILDVKLHGNAIYPVAEALRRRGVPFVFATGYDRDAIAPAFRDAQHFEKPTEASSIVNHLLHSLRWSPVALNG
ncbi:MAG: response regulator [Acetobacteraceae bacterium]|nr:response regulator [Acetobacteraceae bacterium]